MAVTRSFLRSFFRGEQINDPSEVLRRVNSELSDGNDACMFVTLFCSVERISNGTVKFANAGHNPPLLRLQDGTHRFIDEPSGAVAGVIPNLSFACGTIDLPTGAMLILYTDGVTEVMNANGEGFGEDRMEASILKTPPTASSEEVTQQLLKDIRDHTDGTAQSGDISLLLLRRCKVSGNASNDFYLQFSNNHRDLEHALDELENRLSMSHPKTAQTARLVLEELGTNIIKYGYDDTGPHIVKVRFKDGLLVQVIIEGDGHPFNPLQDAPAASIDAALEDRPIGGLGIHMI